MLARIIPLALLLALLPSEAQAQRKAKEKAPDFPPKLPGGKDVVTVHSPALLEAPAGIAKDVVIAKAPPEISFLYFPGQDYAGKPWSVWGESLFAGGKYYAAIGDHLAPQGNAFVYVY